MNPSHLPPAARPIEQARDADLRLSQPALRRAAQRARELAARTGTALIVRRGERIERIEPAPIAAQQPVAPYDAAGRTAQGDA